MLGQFSEDYTGFQKWTRITRNHSPDYNPDAWIGVDTGLVALKDSLLDTMRLTQPQIPRSQIVFIVPSETTSVALNDRLILSWECGDMSMISGWIIEYSTNQGRTWTVLNESGMLTAETKNYTVSMNQLFNNPKSCIIFKVIDYMNPYLEAESEPVCIE